MLVAIHAGWFPCWLLPMLVATHAGCYLCWLLPILVGVPADCYPWLVAIHADVVKGTISNG